MIHGIHCILFRTFQRFLEHSEDGYVRYDIVRNFMRILGCPENPICRNDTHRMCMRILEYAELIIFGTR